MSKRKVKSTEADANQFDYQDQSRPGQVPNPDPIVVTNKITPFEELSHYNLDEFEYERNGSNPGKVLIFNHEVFVHSLLQPRKGSRRDVNEIIMCFQRLGFNIDESDILNNLTAQEIFNKIDSVLKDEKTLSEANCLIIFFLTHGEEDDQIYAFDKTISCSDIWTKFGSCKQLEGKPKMFVFQACKGEGYATTDGDQSIDDPNQSKIVNLDNFTVARLSSDMLILFSTIEGKASFRDLNSGTWFVQELCKNLMFYGRRDDVISLITRTIKCVSGNYYVKEEAEYQKQMPMFVSTLSRKFYLNRNKDRHYLLEMNRKQDEMHDMLKEIVSYISSVKK